MVEGKKIPQLSIVLPAYEEAPNLDRLLPVLNQIAARLASSYEILVIDTQSPKDETPAVCLRHLVRYVPREGGALYGDAVRTALKEAAGTFVVLMDADGSHNPRYLTELWNQRENADLIIASRYVSGGKTENPAVLIFMSLAVNVVFRLVLGLKCYDVSNSFRLYRGADLRALNLRCNHFDIVEEILVKLIAFHPEYRIKEIPCVFEKRKAGKTKRNLITFALGYFVTLGRMAKLKREAQKQARETNR
jgi:dolichol-phosphate mannosyltransferase